MQTSCAFGHIYDSDQYPSCPYCNRGTRAIVFGAGGSGNTVMPGRQDTPMKTVAPGAADATMKTVAPGAADATMRTVAPVAFGGDAVGKTEIPESLKARMQQEEQNKTVGIFMQKHGIEPVVGWLVCIAGPDKGADYRILSRINTIGRAEGNDVVIPSEQTVSQKNHARIAYDARHNNFQIIPGEGHNVIYVNDMPLYVPQLLRSHDIIELGDTKLIFVPLCTEQFRWPEEDKG